MTEEDLKKLLDDRRKTQEAAQAAQRRERAMRVCQLVPGWAGMDGVTQEALLHDVQLAQSDPAAYRKQRDGK